MWLSSRVPRGAILAFIVVAPFVNGGCSCGPTGPTDGSAPARTPAEYSTIVSTFTIGALGLETTDPTHTDSYLTKMTQIAPEEPAGWANLGLYQISKTLLKEAGESLARASRLAPGNADIERLQAMLADRNGDLPGAIAHYQKAVEAAPDNLRIRFALAKELDRQGTPEGDSASQAAMQGILDRQPSNLVALVELARISGKRGDLDTLKKSIAILEARSSTFDAASLDKLKALKDSVAAKDTRASAINAAFLGNDLMTNIAYHQSASALMKPDKEGLNPIEQFIKLPPIPATPAPPDMSLTFGSAPLFDKGTAGKSAWAGVFWLDDSGAQEMLSVDGHAAHLGSGAALPFPGGAAAADPGPHAVLALDMDYDLKNDLVFAGAGGIKMYRQTAKGIFTDVTARSTLAPAVLNAAYTGAWSADIESDGDLDIVLGRASGPPVVLRNNGDGTWRATQPFAGISGVRDFAWLDIDGDGSTDAAIVDGSGALHVFANQRAGLFRDRKAPDTGGKVAALAVADVNNDGKLDVLALRSDGVIVRVSDKSEGTDWEIAEIARWENPPAGLATGASRLIAADLDNNGGIDLIASAGGATQVWLYGEKGAFATLSPPLFAAVSGAADLDKNGRLDLVGVAADGKAVRLVNKGTKNYAWQELRPRAADEEVAGHKTTLGDQKASGTKASGEPPVNPFGIGGEIEARAGLLYQKQAMNSPVIHIGLGTYPTLDAVRVIWPNGDVRAEFGVPAGKDSLKANQSVTMVHRLHSSCPFLFTWNGKEMRFVTDCIWRSPLGLKINSQDTAGVAQTEDWIKIRGEQLVPDTNGMYDLRITAELWETHFFDHLSLMTVDHPNGTDIFVDERFAIPPPPHQVYFTGVTKPILRAVDDNGTDVTDIVRERDARYLDTFGRGVYQGVTRDHWVEIEIGDEAPKTGPLWLICYGWIHPTNSSVNVALGQSHYPPPQGLSLETPDAQGRWSVARPGLGFPEGKVKTILINLNGVFKPGAPRKLRLRTNLEIFWDSIRWAEGRPDTGVKTVRLLPDTADLRYRGFSDTKSADASSPEMPQSYELLAGTSRQWRDLVGYYTRYGDIRDLLTKIDDRYVIMNAGDEMRLLFKAPAPPPAGWKRDFVLVGDGWVKDGDLNTTYSKTVQPLPYHSQKDYNVPPGRLQDDPAYRMHPHDWQTYHTRYISPDGFQDAFRPGK